MKFVTKSAEARDTEVSRLQAQLLLQVSAQQVIPSEAFQSAYQSICRQYVADGKDVDQLFELSGLNRNIRLVLNSNRQSFVALVKK